jgi:hypothetical protein
MICNTTWSGNPAKTCYPILRGRQATLNPGFAQTREMGGMQTEGPMDADATTPSLCKENLRKHWN